MPNSNFHLENLSFWIGFIAATLFWWLVYSVRPLLPRWWRRFRRLLETISSRNYTEVENYLRRQTILRAQSQHLAASLFSLD
ncbi:MAG TPA: hypothetical protein VFM46_19685, partial [Pseudomonadales bacterium]|nr:hypothetical protein [Pseudomonadales bacterium]